MKKALWGSRYPIRAISDCDMSCKLCELNTRCLAGRRYEIGELEYAREFLCNPKSSSASLFPYELFEKNFDMNTVLVDRYGGGYFPDFLPNDLIVVTGWDFDISERIGTAYMAGFTVGFAKNGDRYVLDIERQRGLPFETDRPGEEKSQLGLVREKHAFYNSRLVVVETNIFQRIYEQELVRTTDIPVKGHTTGSEKADVQMGFPYLRILLENRKYHIPRGNNKSKEITDIWISEGISFGWEGDKLHGVGETDDIMIAWWLCELGYQTLKKLMPKRVAPPVLVPGTGWR